MLRACVVWLVMILVGGAAVVACSSAPTDTKTGLQPSAIVFASDSLRLKEGDSARIVARVVDARGQDIPGATVQFSTGDDTTIGLSVDGLLQGVHPGAAQVVATSGSIRAELTVDVMGHPEGILVGTLPLSSRPFGAAVSRDGIVYVTRLDTASIAITDVTSRQLDGGIAVGKVPTGVAFDPTGKIAYVTNQFSDNVGIIDVNAHAEVDSIGVTGDPFVVVASPDGSKMYVTSNTGWVFAIDTRTHAILDSIAAGSAPNGFAVAPGDTIVYVSAAFGGTVAEIDMRNDEVLRTFNIGGNPQDMIVSREGKELYVANEAGELDVWDLASGTAIVKLPLAAGAFGMALSPDDAHLYISLPDSGMVDVVNISSRTIIHTIQVGGRPRRIAFDYHGGTAVVANEAGSIDFVR